MKNILVLVAVAAGSAIFYWLYFYARRNRFVKSLLVFIYFPFICNYIFSAVVYGHIFPVTPPKTMFNLPLVMVYSAFASFIPPIIILIYYKRHYNMQVREMIFFPAIYLVLGYLYIIDTLPVIACSLFSYCS